MTERSSAKNLNGTLAKAAPETIRCSRHNDGEPFELQKRMVQSATLVHTDLERILTERVMRLVIEPAPAKRTLKKIQQRRTQQQIRQQIFICPRRDVVFLKCFEMSPAHSIQTILGISEDNQGPLVELNCYRAEECKQQQIRRIRRGPHSEWIHESFTAVERKHKDKNGERINDCTKMSWIDLRKFQMDNHSAANGSFLSTEAGVVQFLRSILTPSHDASPWETATDGIEEPYLPSPQIVVLVLNYSPNDGYENDFSLLKTFRVSDAAPSWFLHGFVHLDTLEESPEEVFRQNSVDRPMKEPTSASTLLIYKKLSPRQMLHANLPASPISDRGNEDVGIINITTGTADKAQTGETETETKTSHTIVEKGCLWEEYEAKEDDEIYEEQDGNDDSNQIPTSMETSNEQKNRQYRLVSPPYLNLDEEYPGANLFARLFSKEALDIFTEDALSVPQWTPWPETAHYKVSSFGNEKPWTVFPLCHCFPANEPDNFTWVPFTKSFVPRTCRLLEDALRYDNGQSYLRTALFSQLAPRSVLEEHTGWADLANHVLRLHIPLVVPSNSDSTGENDDLCGTWVDGCVETHAVGRPLLFDDSKTHRAFNYSDGDRIVLIVDLARPERLPLGTAESGHTEELDSFIEQMSVPK
jgi:hypothetical protein